MRTEKDYIGQRQLPDDALYGIHALRARENFPDTTPFHREWYMAMGQVKLAYYLVYKDFKQSVQQNIPDAKLHFWSNEQINALIHAAEEVAQCRWFEHFIVPAVQGGAGTSINMNVNEIIANVALEKLGHRPGQYEIIDPIEHANVYQSTNDTVPTALRVAAMTLLLSLEEAINNTRQVLEQLEQKHRYDLRLGYTQLQEAVPTSFGKQFGAYAEALARDWWRVSKCLERIKFVNLGGSAIGTSLSVPRYFVVEVVPRLRQITGLPIAQAENLVEATQNQDALVEVHATLKAHATNLEKIVSDLRLQASDLVGRGEIILPQAQVGSSIMPSKINPVVPEFVISVAHRVYVNDVLVSSLVGQGQLELNAYLPLVGHALLDSIKLLIAANQTLRDKMLLGLKVNTKVAYDRLLHSPSIATALNSIIGYHRASELAREMRQSGCDIFEANRRLNLLPEDKLREALRPDRLLQKGFSVRDIL